MIYNRLIVAAIGFIRLEPYDGKLSRTVLRGGKDSNALLLPDYASVEMLYHPEYVGKPLAVGVCRASPCSRRGSGSKAWDYLDSQLYSKEKRGEDRNGALAGKNGIPGSYYCTATDGSVSEVFFYAKGNLWRVHGSGRTVWM